MSSLVGSGGDVHSPAATISAVSRRAQEHSEVNGKLTLVGQELEQVHNAHEASHIQVADFCGV